MCVSCFVGLENIQLVCSMSSRQALGRHKLSTRFASIVRVASVGFAEREQLQAVYSAYLRPILGRQLSKHAFWQSSAKVHALAGAMLELFERTRAAFSQDDFGHYLFTARDLTAWCLSFLRYDLLTGGADPNSSGNFVLDVFAYEARRIFRDRLAGAADRDKFEQLLSAVLRTDFSYSEARDKDGSWCLALLSIL